MSIAAMNDLAGSALPTLVSLAVKATALLLLAALGARLLVKSSAATRHVLWTLTVVSLLALPVAQLLLPPIGTPFLSALRSRSPVVVAPSARDEGAPRPRESASARVDGKASSDPVAQTAQPEGVSWALGVLSFWALGVVAVLTFFGLGRRALGHAARRARSLEDADWFRLVAEIRERLGIRRSVRLLIGEPGTAPMTWGTARPVVLLPENAREWSPEQRRAVLVHEMGHVARMDCAIQELAHLACALYWFHPGAWVAARRLRIERERACDDLVLEDGASASRYAQDLVAAVRASRWIHRSHALAAASMAAPSRLEERIRAILDTSQSRRRPSRRLRRIASVLAAGLALPLAALAPRVPAASEAPAAQPPAGDLSSRWDTAASEAKSGRSVWVVYAIPFGGGKDGKETLFSDSEDGHFDEIGLRGSSLAERHGFQKDDAVFLFRVTAKAVSARVPFDRIAIRSGRLALDAGGLRVVSLGRLSTSESLDWLRVRLEAAPDDNRARVLVMAVSAHDLPATAPLLESVLHGSRAGFVRAQAAEGLARHPSSKSLEALVRHARRDSSLEVRRESAEAVGDLDYPRATDALIKLTRDVEDEDVRAEAVESLGAQPADQVIDVLVALTTEDPSERVQSEAVETLGDLPDHAGVPALRRIVKDHPSERVRNEAFETLNHMISENP